MESEEQKLIQHFTDHKNFLERKYVEIYDDIKNKIQQVNDRYYGNIQSSQTTNINKKKNLISSSVEEYKNELQKILELDEQLSNDVYKQLRDTEHIIYFLQEYSRDKSYVPHATLSKNQIEIINCHKRCLEKNESEDDNNFDSDCESNDIEIDIKDLNSE